MSPNDDTPGAGTGPTGEQKPGAAEQPGAAAPRGEDELEAQRARASRAFQNATAEQVLRQYRAIVGPTSQPGLVAEALAALNQGTLPTPLQQAALEQAIRVFRPALLTKGGEAPALSAEVGTAFPDWDTFRAALKSKMPSIGRIDAVGPKGTQGVGTGFLMRPNLLVTNRHVLEQLSSGTGRLERGMARVNFGQEHRQLDTEGAVDIVRHVAEHPTLDLALLEVDASQFTTPRDLLELEPTPVGQGAAVAVVGYPFEDGERNPFFVKQAFGDFFGVKRVAPGEVIKVVRSTIHHDCSTLGGNSGSPLLLMGSGKLVGVHFQGRFATRNSAVAASEVGAFLQQHAPQ